MLYLMQPNIVSTPGWEPAEKIYSTGAGMLTKGNFLNVMLWHTIFSKDNSRFINTYPVSQGTLQHTHMKRTQRLPRRYFVDYTVLFHVEFEHTTLSAVESAMATALIIRSTLLSLLWHPINTVYT